MKRWWRKTPGGLWLDLVANEKTRWVAVVVFLGVTAFANWRVAHAAVTGEAFTRFGRTVNSQTDPISYSTLFIWSILAAVVLDAILVGALIFLYRESKKKGDP